MSYTPGPWKTRKYGEFWSVTDSLDYEVVGCGGLYRFDGTDAPNARLIAAAPELVEALEQAIKWIDDGKMMSAWDEEARALLARIKGEA